jgi:hypothetical protein
LISIYFRVIEPFRRKFWVWGMKLYLPKSEKVVREKGYFLDSSLSFRFSKIGQTAGLPRPVISGICEQLKEKECVG